jgi:hypothetical protein
VSAVHEAAGGSLALATGNLVVADLLESSVRANLEFDTPETPKAIPSDAIGDPDMLVVWHSAGSGGIELGYMVDAAFVSSGQTVRPGRCLIVDLTGFTGEPYAQMAADGSGATISCLLLRKPTPL